MPEEVQTVVLHDAFYRDGLGKIIFIIIGLCLAILLLVALSLYLYFNKPAPIVFPVYQDWRVQPLVAVDQPYLPSTEVMQWVSDTMQKVLVYDFKNYNAQLKEASQYFTSDGWKTFLNQLNLYVNYTNVQTNKLFVKGKITAAPTLINQGLIAGRYTWTIQMPMILEYAGFKPLANKVLPWEIRVVRVPTTDNLSGLAIDSVVLAATGMEPAIGSG
jgi:intracellular multiplication protein IcmL